MFLSLRYLLLLLYFVVPIPAKSILDDTPLSWAYSGTIPSNNDRIWLTTNTANDGTLLVGGSLRSNASLSLFPSFNTVTLTSSVFATGTTANDNMLASSFDMLSTNDTFISLPIIDGSFGTSTDGGLTWTISSSNTSELQRYGSSFFIADTRNMLPTIPGIFRTSVGRNSSSKPSTATTNPNTGCVLLCNAGGLLAFSNISNPLLYTVTNDVQCSKDNGKTWFTAVPLPFPLYGASATQASNGADTRILMVGGIVGRNTDNNVRFLTSSTTGTTIIPSTSPSTVIPLLRATINIGTCTISKWDLLTDLDAGRSGNIGSNSITKNTGPRIGMTIMYAKERNKLIVGGGYDVAYKLINTNTSNSSIRSFLYTYLPVPDVWNSSRSNNGTYNTLWSSTYNIGRGDVSNTWNPFTFSLPNENLRTVTTSSNKFMYKRRVNTFLWELKSSANFTGKLGKVVSTVAGMSGLNFVPPFLYYNGYAYYFSVDGGETKPWFPFRNVLLSGLSQPKYRWEDILVDNRNANRNRLLTTSMSSTTTMINTTTGSSNTSSTALSAPSSSSSVTRSQTNIVLNEVVLPYDNMTATSTNRSLYLAPSNLDANILSTLVSGYDIISLTYDEDGLPFFVSINFTSGNVLRGFLQACVITYDVCPIGYWKGCITSPFDGLTCHPCSRCDSLTVNASYTSWTFDNYALRQCSVYQDSLCTNDGNPIIISPSYSPSPSATPTGTGSSSGTVTPTGTRTGTGTSSSMSTVSNSPISSITATVTSTTTLTTSPTGTVTSTPTTIINFTVGPSSLSSTASPTPSSTPSTTASTTVSFTVTPSSTLSLSATVSETPTATVSLSSTVSLTPSASSTVSLTPSASSTVSLTPSASVSSLSTSVSLTGAPSVSVTASVSFTSSSTVLSSSTVTSTRTPSTTPSATPSPIQAGTVCSQNVSLPSQFRCVNGYIIDLLVGNNNNGAGNGGPTNTNINTTLNNNNPSSGTSMPSSQYKATENRLYIITVIVTGLLLLLSAMFQLTIALNPQLHPRNCFCFRCHVRNMLAITKRSGQKNRHRFYDVRRSKRKHRNIVTSIGPESLSNSNDFGTDESKPNEATHGITRMVTTGSRNVAQSVAITSSSSSSPDNNNGTTDTTPLLILWRILGTHLIVLYICIHVIYIWQIHQAPSQAIIRPSNLVLSTDLTILFSITLGLLPVCLTILSFMVTPSARALVVERYPWLRFICSGIRSVSSNSSNTTIPSTLRIRSLSSNIRSPSSSDEELTVNENGTVASPLPPLSSPIGRRYRAQEHTKSTNHGREIQPTNESPSFRQFAHILHTELLPGIIAVALLYEGIAAYAYYGSSSLPSKTTVKAIGHFHNFNRAVMMQLFLYYFPSAILTTRTANAVEEYGGWGFPGSACAFMNCLLCIWGIFSVVVRSLVNNPEQTSKDNEETVIVPNVMHRNGPTMMVNEASTSLMDDAYDQSVPSVGSSIRRIEFVPATIGIHENTDNSNRNNTNDGDRKNEENNRRTSTVEMTSVPPSLPVSAASTGLPVTMVPVVINPQGNEEEETKNNSIDPFTVRSINQDNPYRTTSLPVTLPFNALPPPPSFLFPTAMVPITSISRIPSSSPSLPPLPSSLLRTPMHINPVFATNPFFNGNSTSVLTNGHSTTVALPAHYHPSRSITNPFFGLPNTDPSIVLTHPNVNPLHNDGEEGDNDDTTTMYSSVPSVSVLSEVPDDDAADDDDIIIIDREHGTPTVIRRSILSAHVHHNQADTSILRYADNGSDYSGDENSNDDENDDDPQSNV